MKTGKFIVFGAITLLLFSLSISPQLRSQHKETGSGSDGAKDPGVRAGSVNAGTPLSTLTTAQLQFFQDGQTRFQQVDQVTNGLGPTFNSNSCSSCHAQPAVGGTSPASAQYPNIGPNPQLEPGTASGASNTMPSGPANGGLVNAIEQHASSGSEANTW